jgi:CheY-like chemotaxis protein
VIDDRRDGPILVVDDDPELRGVTVLLLRRSLGAEVVGVEDGATALAMALHAPVALIVTDIQMPGLDGCGLIRQLRADARTRDVPVLAVSGGSRRAQALAAGADGFLAKPFAPRRLVEEARRWLTAEPRPPDAGPSATNAQTPERNRAIGQPDVPGSS